MPLVLESYFITCVSKLFGLELKPVDMKVGAHPSRYHVSSCPNALRPGGYHAISLAQELKTANTWCW